MLNLPSKWSLPHSSYLGLGEEISSIHKYLKDKYDSEVKMSRPFRKDSKKSSESYDDRLNSLARNIYERHTARQLEALNIHYEYTLEENIQIKFWMAPFIVVCVAFLWPSTEISTISKIISSFIALLTTTYWLNTNNALNQYRRVVQMALLIHKKKE